ncbi:MAG: EamA family transporter [Candidatus Shapirobacteria bacterium]
MWLGEAILAQAFASVANFTDKYVLEKYIKDSATVFIFSGSVAALVGVLLFAVRGFPIIPPFQILMAVLAGIFLQLYLLPYFKALDEEDPSKIVVLFQLIPVFTLILSALFLGERLKSMQILGFGVILVSSVFVARQSGKKNKIGNRAIWLMVLSSFVYAISTILFKFVVDLQNLWDSLAYEGLGMGVGVLLVLLYPKFLGRVVSEVKNLPVKGWGGLWLSEIFYIGCRLLLAAAFSVGSVSLVNVMGGFQPVFLVIYGYVLTKFFPKIIKEDIKASVLRKKLWGILGVFVGLYLIFV